MKIFFIKLIFFLFSCVSYAKSIDEFLIESKNENKKIFIISIQNNEVIPKLDEQVEKLTEWFLLNSSDKNTRERLRIKTGSLLPKKIKLPYLLYFYQGKPLFAYNGAIRSSKISALVLSVAKKYNFFLEIKNSTCENDPKILSVLNEVNKLRQDRGLNTLHLNEKLCASSFAHSKDMNERQYFSHVSPDGNAVDVRVVQAGYAYDTTAENIAVGVLSAKQVVEEWMNSPGHRKNILAADYEEIGIGYTDGQYKEKYQDAQVTFWVQNFGIEMNLPLNKILETE